MAYIFVDFRLKRAGRANYRGATFRLGRKMAKYLNPKQYRVANVKIVNNQ